eukprot:Skav231815  [mRNA]  locus=scaffold692:441618:443613:+ [translate_table: standard]
MCLSRKLCAFPAFAPAAKSRSAPQAGSTTDTSLMCAEIAVHKRLTASAWINSWWHSSNFSLTDARLKRA